LHFVALIPATDEIDTSWEKARLPTSISIVSGLGGTSKIPRRARHNARACHVGTKPIPMVTAPQQTMMKASQLAAPSCRMTRFEGSSKRKYLAINQCASKEREVMYTPGKRPATQYCRNCFPSWTGPSPSQRSVQRQYSLCHQRVVFCREVDVGGWIPINQREDIEKTYPRE